MGCHADTHIASFKQLGKKLVHHGSRSRPILVALDLMPAKKQVMSNRFKLASSVCEVQADGFVIFVMIIS